ncbi:N-acetylmuramoyl-L-alanine amidase [filamentous cyanobacterium CCP2]|nr:N-acetylmuramoyl-L-alanine amidase [filamentous cyanobacterium CCP2]
MPSILGAIGVFFLASPVEAARLVLWRFSPNENRLTFNTDEAVQPRVQLIANPTRLVVDLPGTTFGRPQVEQAVGGGIRAVRVGQFDDATTRIVIELEAGYSLDPEQVRVRGTTASQWTVELPEPEPGSEPIAAESVAVESADTVAESFSPLEAATQIEELRLTRDGLFIRTRGETPDIDEDYSRRRRRLTIEIENAAFSPEVVRRELELNDYGIERIELVQAEVDDDDPPTANIVLYFKPDVDRWRVNVSEFGGIVLTPRQSSILAGVQSPRSLTAATDSVSSSLPVPDRPIPVPSPDRPAPLPAPTQPVPDVSRSRVTITIDPGHGGRDPGAVGIGGIREAEIVLDISRQVAALLEEQGVQVVMTRQDDREVGLEPRVQLANRAGSNLFVSIHANAISLSRPDVNGLETYYYSSAGERLAQVIHDTVLQMTGVPDRQVRFARFYVLRHTSMPAVLVEVGFVTGDQDSRRLADPDFRTSMAEAITAGILRYVQQNF